MEGHEGSARDRLTLRTRLLSEPCLWSWEIVYDAGEPLVLESSWEDDWLAYESREEAQRAGAAALAELIAA